MATLARDINTLSQTLLGKKFTWHHLRYTFATRQLKGKEIIGQDGREYRIRGDVKTVAAIGGWACGSRILMEVYQQIDEEDKYHHVSMMDIGERDIEYRDKEEPEVATYLPVPDMAQTVTEENRVFADLELARDKAS